MSKKEMAAKPVKTATTSEQQADVIAYAPKSKTIAIRVGTIKRGLQ